MRDLQSIALRELLPPSIASDPDILGAAEAIDRELHKSTGFVPGVSIIPRLRGLTDEQLIDLLAWQFHVDFWDPDLPMTVEMKRELVAKSLDWHTRKGTPSTVEEVVTAVFGDARVLEWFEYGGSPYTFKVETEITDVTLRRIRILIDAIFAMKNTRSWLDGIDIKWKSDMGLYAGAGVVQDILNRVPMWAYSKLTEPSTFYQASFVHVTPTGFTIPKWKLDRLADPVEHYFTAVANILPVASIGLGRWGLDRLADPVDHYFTAVANVLPVAPIGFAQWQLDRLADPADHYAVAVMDVLPVAFMIPREE